MSLMLTCKEISGLVSDYLDHRLPMWDRMRFRAHVAMCPDCQEWVRQLEITKETLGHAPEVDVPDEIAPELLEAFKGWTHDEPEAEDPS